jgi:hypothetical protein
MNKRVIKRSERIYDLFLRLYPKSYRQEFGDEMKYVFAQSIEDAYNENKEQEIINFWVRIFIDTYKSIFTQHLLNLKESKLMKTKNTDILMQNKVFGYILSGIGLLLLIPLLANWPWTLSDFVIMGAIMLTFASLFVFLARRTQKYRLVVGIVVLSAFLWLWAELAVGVFTNWGS